MRGEVPAPVRPGTGPCRRPSLRTYKGGRCLDVGAQATPGQRLRSLVLLTLLVAVASGVVLAAVAGARRDRTAMDRLVARGDTAHVWALANLPGQLDWNRVRALPYVESTRRLRGGGTTTSKAIRSSLGFFRRQSGAVHSVERGVVVEGHARIPTASMR